MTNNSDDKRTKAVDRCEVGIWCKARRLRSCPPLPRTLSHPRRRRRNVGKWRRVKDSIGTLLHRDFRFSSSIQSKIPNSSSTWAGSQESCQNYRRKLRGNRGTLSTKCPKTILLPLKRGFRLWYAGAGKKGVSDSSEYRPHACLMVHIKSWGSE